ncbi:MAG: tRNA-(ms[2]io[6]A)-hydroxylase [Pseudomonadales bacterium]|nr:tRNA-(ms[2]io[6]A)-hydroxylase [Pseudomonadales bacterium]
MTFTLKHATPLSWTETVLEDFDQFLLDHASCEKKASGMAVNLLSHYPDRAELVTAMTNLAIEELNHFREVTKLIHARGLALGTDSKDPYINRFRKAIRRGSDEYMLDQLLIASIVEARGAERFGLISQALDAGPVKEFYIAITKSEQRHKDLFIELAKQYLPAADVEQRLEELLDIEAAIVAELPDRAALH